MIKLITKIIWLIIRLNILLIVTEAKRVEHISVRATFLCSYGKLQANVPHIVNKTQFL